MALRRVARSSRDNGCVKAPEVPSSHLHVTAFARDAQWAALRAATPFDVLVIGGGASGLGVALDATARGFRTALVEAYDFGKGTSSRATKLVHGGVRYMAQGNVALVREALHERRTMLDNAPHLAQPLAFVVPGYKFWEPAIYGTGLKLYDALAGARGLGPTRMLGAASTRRALPGVQPHHLMGGVEYWDGQFDDARLALALARTAAARGAVVINRVKVTALHAAQSGARGVTVLDTETGRTLDVQARCVINATGVWVDDILAMDNASPSGGGHSSIVAPSQGVHLVVSRDFLPGSAALMVPKTADGRVLFAVPWLGKVILGTTDTPRTDMPLEPQPLAHEVDFILAEAGRYLARAPRRSDVLSAWAGLRPLVKPSRIATDETKGLSREHTVLVSASGLVTVTGGKWTTYRAMAEDVLARCMAAKLLAPRRAGATQALRVVGAPPRSEVSLIEPPGPHLYGAEAPVLSTLPGAARWLWRDGSGGLSEAMVRFAARFEMARGVEDVLARRSRLLFLDARQAQRVAADVAAILQDEIGRDASACSLSEFTALAQQYDAVSTS